MSDTELTDEELMAIMSRGSSRAVWELERVKDHHEQEQKIPHEYRTHYFRGRSLKKDIIGTVVVVVIWCALTTAALWFGVLH